MAAADESGGGRRYRLDPELAVVEPFLPVPAPASPHSGVAEAEARRLRASENRRRAGLGMPDLDGLEVVDHVAPGGPGDPDVAVRALRCGTVVGEVGALLWFHGGGFSTGSIFDGDTGAAGLARALDVVVLDVEYRLAPEHPAPAAVEDGLAVLRWAYGRGRELGINVARIAVGGTSAGAGIAAGLCLAARDGGGPPICFQSLSTPVLDDRLETPSMRRFVDTPVINRHSMEESWRWYLGALSDGEVPACAAPARASDLRGLPSAYVSVAEFDPLRDEGILYALRLLEDNVSVELHCFPGTFHASEVVASAEVSRRQSVERIGALRRALASG